MSEKQTNNKRRTSNFKDLTGQKFGRLTVLQEGAYKFVHRKIVWTCLCDCGEIKDIVGGSLIRGLSTSCGCKRRENTSRVTHGLSKANLPEYRIWKAMRTRCNNPNFWAYKYYGGRGIKICPRWDSFVNFYSDMGSRTSPLHSIHRVDNDKGYCKSNCVWATMQEHTDAKGITLFVEAFGQKKTLRQWAEVLNISPTAIRDRLRRGWPAEEAVSVLPYQGRYGNRLTRRIKP